MRIIHMVKNRNGNKYDGKYGIKTIWDQEKMTHSDAEDVDFEIWFWVINAVESDVNMNNCGKEEQ